MREFPTPPDGYEIVDREAEPGTEVDSRTWLICYPERPSCTGWRRPGTGAGLWSVSEFPHDAVLARPIRKPTCDGSTSTCGPECWTPSVVDVGPSKRAADSETAPVPASPWVRASERQPPAGIEVPTWRDGAALGWKRRPNNHPCHDLPEDVEWLDLEAVDRLAAENDRLREELVNEREISGARIAELEKELDRCRDSGSENVRLRSELRRARDTEISLLRTVDQLRREKERGPVELTFSELVRMAVRDQPFDPEA